MMLRRSALALLALVALVFSQTLEAQDLPEATEAHVLDLAGALDATEAARIERLLAETEASTGVVMEVVTLADAAAHGGAGERLEDYAARLLQAWTAGEEARQDGVLILVETASAEARIAMGGAYPAVYDERAARVLSSALLPPLREGRVGAAVEAGVISARDRLVTPFLAGATVTASDGFEALAPPVPSWLPYILSAAAVLGAVGYLWRRAALARRTCPSCGATTLNRTREMIDPPARSQPGSGIEHRLCDNCGFTDRRFHVLTPGILGGPRWTPRK
jgi:uncharacterized membrane protein YgcG